MRRPEFTYAREKLSAARRALMAPHPQGENVSFGIAFTEVMHGLKTITDEHFGDEDRPKELVQTLRRYIDMEGEGTWEERIDGMTNEEKSEFSDALDSLLYYLKD